MDYEVPHDLKYTPTHEWVRIKGDLAIVGITDYAQHQLGDIVYIEFPNIGTSFEKGKSAGEIESVKAIEDFFMPLSGKITEINEKIVDNPELVNKSPYKDGWMLKVKITKFAEVNQLLSVEAYKELIEKED